MLRRVMRGFITAGCIGWFLVGCGGNQAPAESPAEPEPLTLEAKAEPSEEPKAAPGGDEDQGDGLASNQGKTEKKPVAVEPSFKEGGSVEEAIAAVPQGTPRVNVEQESLAKPLMDENLYKPCKMSPTQHFKLRVAIWDGKAVGIDLSATPKNDKAVACIKQQVYGISWRDKVKSLNTVEYQF